MSARLVWLMVVSIERADEVIVPRGDLVLEPCDRLRACATPQRREELLDLLAEG